MSDPDTLPAGVHPEVELLPWYLTGTLQGDDRQRVARHLETCRDCSRELQDLTQIRQALTELSRQEAEPSAHVYRSVMARVAADSKGQHPAPRDTSWAASVDRWFRSLFTPQWVPTLAAVLLLAQMGLLLWVTLPPADRSEVSTRSVGMPSQAKKFLVVFQGSATEERIRSLLQRVHARIVGGPEPDGTFVITLEAGDPAVALGALRAQRDIIRSAEPLQP